VVLPRRSAGGRSQSDCKPQSHLTVTPSVMHIQTELCMIVHNSVDHVNCA
jgi:hypothetical protein